MADTKLPGVADRHLVTTIKYLLSTHCVTEIVPSMRNTGENEQGQSLPSCRLHRAGIKLEGQ